MSKYRKFIDYIAEHEDDIRYLDGNHPIPFYIPMLSEVYDKPQHKIIADIADEVTANDNTVGSNS